MLVATLEAVLGQYKTTMPKEEYDDSLLHLNVRCVCYVSDENLLRKMAMMDDDNQLLNYR